MKRKKMRKIFKQTTDERTNEIKIEPIYELIPVKNLYQ
jgi:hypothetical protein